MKKIVLSTVALFAMTSFAAAAEPLRLTDAQMDNITAGQDITNPGGIQVAALNNVNANVLVAIPVQAAVCVIAECQPQFQPQDIVNRPSVRFGG
jgi:hypothetical protein